LSDSGHAATLAKNRRDGKHKINDYSRAMTLERQKELAKTLAAGLRVLRRGAS
jgi:hypothetical protein